MQLSAFLFNDMILLAHQQPGRDGMLTAAMDPVYLSDIADVDYTPTSNGINCYDQRSISVSMTLCLTS